jgi:hypothetical protein
VKAAGIGASSDTACARTQARSAGDAQPPRARGCGAAAGPFRNGTGAIWCNGSPARSRGARRRRPPRPRGARRRGARPRAPRPAGGARRVSVRTRRRRVARPLEPLLFLSPWSPCYFSALGALAISQRVEGSDASGPPQDQEGGRPPARARGPRCAPRARGAGSCARGTGALKVVIVTKADARGGRVQRGEGRVQRTKIRGRRTKTGDGRPGTTGQARGRGRGRGQHLSLSRP